MTRLIDFDIADGSQYGANSKHQETCNRKPATSDNVDNFF